MTVPVAGEVKVAIVGAGLVGALAAIHMSRLGYSVEVYEKRQDLRTEGLSEGRSIKLALSLRGITALKAVGLDTTVLSETIPLKARMIHSADGHTHEIPYGDFGEMINSISRHRLNEVLLDAAEREGRISLFFEHELCTLDLGKRPRATFRNLGTGALCTVQCDFVLGCDGAYSAVRRELMRTVRLDYSQEYTRHGYKEFYIPADAGGRPRMPRNYLHIWPRREFMLVSLPNTDGSFTASLFYPHQSFHAIKGDEAAREFFSREFPDAYELMGGKSVCEAFRCNPVGSLVTIRCSQYHHQDKAVLLGDAAHAMVPFFGQGMNAGFEDLTVLLPLLRSMPRSRAFAEFSRTRVPDARAICDLALYNYWEVSSGVASRMFRMKKRLYGCLHKLLPATLLPLYTMVAFTNMAYSQVLARHRRQERIVSAVLLATSIAALLLLGLIAILAGRHL